MSTVDTDRALAAFRTTMTRRRDRRRSFVAAAAALVLVAGAAGYAAMGGDEEPTAVTAARPLTDDDVRWTAELEGALAPRGIDVVAGEVLVSAGEQAVRLDPSSGEVLGSLRAGVFVSGPFAETDTGVWGSYEDGTRRGYARFDLETGRVEAVADVGESYFLDSGGAGLWAVPSGNALVELDPGSGAVLRRVELPFRPYGLWVGDEVVWAQAASGGALARIDARTGAVTDGPDLDGSAPGALVGQELWVYEPTAAELVRLDVATGEERGRTRLQAEPAPEREARVGVASEDGAVYAVSQRPDGSTLLSRIEARTGEVVALVDLGRDPAGFAIGAGEGAVFVAPFTTSRVQSLVPVER
jgi:streptogramin lyase